MNFSNTSFIGNFHEGLAYIAVSCDARQNPYDYIYIDKDGNIISKEKYQVVSNFVNGKAYVGKHVMNSKDELFFIDKNGNKIQ